MNSAGFYENKHSKLHGTSSGLPGWRIYPKSPPQALPSFNNNNNNKHAYAGIPVIVLHI
jgi:hypothetical protein